MNVAGVNYISLTDLARYMNPDDPSGVIRNWMSNKNSFAFYSLWEELNNSYFNSVGSHRIKINEVPYNRFTMTPNRWKNNFNAIGIIPGKGRYSRGTYAHPDIAFEFASWLSPEFKMYLIKEFERLKIDEAFRSKTAWYANRMISKVNYFLHTDAIEKCIIPNLTDNQKKFIYSDEADILNVALFGMTAKEWRRNNRELSKSANIRDNADILHLIILNNLESLNAELIKMNLSQSERLMKLNASAKEQIELLKNNKNIEKLALLEESINFFNK